MPIGGNLATFQTTVFSALEKQSGGDVHGSVQDPDQDDAIFDRTVKQDKAVDIPTPEIRREFGAGSAHQIIGGKIAQLLVEKPDRHYRILQTAFVEIIFDGNVVFPAYPGSKNARHDI